MKARGLRPKVKEQERERDRSYMITRSHEVEAQQIIPGGAVQLTEEPGGGGGGGGRGCLGLPRSRLGRRRGRRGEAGGKRGRRADGRRPQQPGGAFPDPHGRSTAAEPIGEEGGWMGRWGWGGRRDTPNGEVGWGGFLLAAELEAALDPSLLILDHLFSFYFRFKAFFHSNRRFGWQIATYLFLAFRHSYQPSDWNIIVGPEGTQLLVFVCPILRPLASGCRNVQHRLREYVLICIYIQYILCWWTA